MLRQHFNSIMIGQFVSEFALIMISFDLDTCQYYVMEMLWF